MIDDVKRYVSLRIQAHSLRMQLPCPLGELGRVADEAQALYEGLPFRERIAASRAASRAVPGPFQAILLNEAE
jgi:hypothetical protein